MSSTIQPSFSSGEITPSAHGRVDLAKYQSGAKTVRNMITRVHGGLVNRPGTEFVAEVKDSTKTGRLIPFIFSTTQSYVTVFGDASMLVVKDGGLVLEANKTITGTTNATPVVVTSNAHGYSNGNRVFISGTGIAALDGKYWIVAGVAANTFQLSGSTAPGSTSATGTAGRVFDLATPYTEAQLPLIKYTQLNDVMTLTNGAAGLTGVQPKDLSRSDHAAWTITDMPFEEGPFQDVNATQSKGMLASGQTGSINISAIGHTPFTAAQVGMLVYLEQKDYGIPWEVGKSISVGDIRRSDGKYYKALTAGTTGTLRPQNETGSTESDGGVTWRWEHNGYGIALITAFVNSASVTATVLVKMPLGVIGAVTVTNAVSDAGKIKITTGVTHGFVAGESVYVFQVGGTTEANGVWEIESVTATEFTLVGSTFTNAYTSGGSATKTGTHRWALGAWGGDQGWPAAITYFQQRKTLATTPTQPVKTWHSGTNAFRFFGRSAPIVDDDSFSMTLASNRADPIRHLVSLGKLVALTAGCVSEVRPRVIGGGQWIIPDDDNNPILTPSKRSARSQEADSILYNAEKGQTVFDLAYQFTSNNFGGRDLSVLSKHLFEGHTIVDAAFQNVPFQVDWEVRDDGTLLGMTYLKEHEVWGWHHHDTQNGFFERVAVVPEGNEDRVYFLVRRTVNGQTKRYIERLSSRLYTDARDAKFLDSCLTYDGRNTTAKTMTVSGGATWNYQTETFTLTASAAHFASADVGSEIHMQGADGRILRLAITAFTSATVVTVSANRNVPVEFHAVAKTAWGHAKKTFSNLQHLEAATVSILADAHVHPQKVVASGAVTLQYCATVVHIGLPIEADFETLNLNIASAGLLLDKEKLTFAVRVMVENSRGIWAGPNPDNLYEYAQRNDEGYDEPVDALTGIATIRVAATWEPGGRIFIRQLDPLPLSILAVMPEFEIGRAK